MRRLALIVAMAVASGAPSSAQVPVSVASVLETARRGGDGRHALDVARQSPNDNPSGDLFTAQRVRDTIRQALDDSRRPLDADGLVQRLIEIATLNAVAGERRYP